MVNSGERVDELHHLITRTWLYNTLQFYLVMNACPINVRVNNSVIEHAGQHILVDEAFA